MSRRLLVATFGDERDILSATRKARAAGLTVLDVYTPFPVHGLDAAAGVKPTKLPWICFALGLSGAAAKLWYQIWTSATSWPVNVGGKPVNSVPAFVPVTFEIMVLFAAVGTVLAFLIVSRLRPGRKPAFVYDRTTDDRFTLVLVQDDAGFDVEAVRRMLEPSGLLGMTERIETPVENPQRGSFLLRPGFIGLMGAGVLLFTLLTYLTPRDFTEPNLMILPGMARSVPYDPFSVNENFPDGKTLRMPVAGTIARGFAPIDSSRSEETAAAVRAATAGLTPDEIHTIDERATTVFSTFCQPCHGASGAGDGLIVQHGFPPPPSLAAANALHLKDGQMFNIITYGRGNMPSLGHRVGRDDRWLAIRHVRQLQKAAAPAAGGPNP